MDKKFNISDVSKKRIVKWNKEILDKIDMPSDSGDTGIRIASQDVIDETNELYIYHLTRRIDEVGSHFPLENRLITLPENARFLQKLADKFITSRQRKWAYVKARHVDIENLDFYTFKQLMLVSFQDDKIAWQKVLALFYFCSDLSIRALQEHVTDYFIRIYNWTTFYLSNRLSVWVEEQGGWCVVLQISPTISYATRLSILGFCCISVLAICIYIKNKNK